MYVCVCGAVGKFAGGRPVFLVSESFLVTAGNTLLKGVRPSQDLYGGQRVQERETTSRTFKL